MIPVEFRLGLIGYPLEHSLSPLLHQVALQACELKGEYRLYPMPPGEERSMRIIRLFDALRDGRIHGLNVTIPLKQIVMESLDRLTPTAEAIGAVNTIYHENRQLVGDNTDAPGFMVDLCRLYHPQSDRPSVAIILGAGGAARAVAFALTQAGWQAIIAARRPEQARELIEQITRTARSSLKALSDIDSDLQAMSEELFNLGSSNVLVVNATPVGMFPEHDQTPWPEKIPLPRGAFVYDLVYNPTQTLLIRKARRSGLAVANGMGMLIEQAALAFERWTGLEAPRAAMRRAVSMDGG
jgi:shikimate dehydrogenase